MQSLAPQTKRLLYPAALILTAALFFGIGTGLGKNLAPSSSQAGQTGETGSGGELYTQAEYRPDQAAGSGGSTRMAAPAGAPSSFRSVAEAVLPVVVEVNVVEVVEQEIPRFDSPFEFFFGPQGRGEEEDENTRKREYRRPGLGSGVIIRQDGGTAYILTNNHVVGDADEISIRLHDEREFEAEIVGKDSRTDLALLQFSADESVPVASLGDSEKLHIGDWVLAVGNPYGFESTVTAGIVSAVKREAEQAGLAQFTDYIQTDASINPGNSGGALVNQQGEIVGINTWIASRDGGNVGLGFAVPINNAKKVIEDFITKGKVEYGWLGVAISEPPEKLRDHLEKHYGLPEGQQGAFVNNVYTNSPAGKAGIMPGDMITQVDGTEVEDFNHLSRVIGTKAPGATVPIQLIRDGKSREHTIQLTARKEDSKRGNEKLWPGFSAAPLTGDLRERLNLEGDQKGIVITGVAPGSPAARARLQQGDVVTKVDQAEITNLGDLYRSLEEGSFEYRLRVTREGSSGVLLLEK